MEALPWSLIYVCIYMKLFCEVGDQLSLMLFQYLYVNFQTNEVTGVVQEFFTKNFYYKL